MKFFTFGTRLGLAPSGDDDTLAPARSAGCDAVDVAVLPRVRVVLRSNNSPARPRGVGDLRVFFLADRKAERGIRFGVGVSFAIFRGGEGKATSRGCRPVGLRKRGRTAFRFRERIHTAGTKRCPGGKSPAASARRDARVSAAAALSLCIITA